jgi:flagellin
MDQREVAYIGTMTSKGLGLMNQTGDIASVSTIGLANKSIGIVDAALEKVSKQRADLGAYQNRLEYAAKGLLNAHENTQASESRIRDTDMAEEMIGFTKNQILTQSGTAMLAQANVIPQSVLQLLR